MDRSGTLELAHVMPGRVRLRWRGQGAPPSGLLARLRNAASIQQVDYRPSSRSLLVLPQNGFELDELVSLAGEFDVAVSERPSPPAAAPQGAGRLALTDEQWQRLIADLEGLLTLGLMVTWIRDLVLTRTIRLTTILLIILTGIGLYESWRRRRQVEQQPSQEEPAPELELLPA